MKTLQHFLRAAITNQNKNRPHPFGELNGSVPVYVLHICFPPSFGCALPYQFDRKR